MTVRGAPIPPNDPGRRTYALFRGEEGGPPLGDLCLRLMSHQRQTWPACRDGYAALARARIREVSCAGFSVRVQHNPGRMRSTAAVVEEKAVKERPCFLCVPNLPPDQEGILYRGGYLILCNPMPVLSPHFTVSHLEHRPQAIEENVGTLLRLAGDLGGGWAVLYNGPKCGASAPDHLHFQVVPSGRMPIEEEIGAEGAGLSFLPGADGVRVGRVQGRGREAVLVEGGSAAGVERAFGDLVGALRQVLPSAGEPMMSAVCLHDSGRWRLLVFPRAKHRPDAFYGEGDARLMVSPAVIEMGGLLVTPREEDFERLDAARIEGIFAEVSLPGADVERALGLMG